MTHLPRHGGGEPNGPPTNGRLDSWKAIASYLNRGIRTVERWEREEGLPIHRLQHEKRGSVYAYRTELDRWWESRGRDSRAEVPAPAVAEVVRNGTPPSPSSWALPAAGAIALAALVATFFSHQPPGRPPVATAEFIRLTSDAGLTAWPAVSADGKLLAYASDRSAQHTLSVWIQLLPRGKPVQIIEQPANASEPAFSPDGSTIAFRSEADDGGVDVVSVSGGAPRRIAPQGRRPRFSPDGAWIAYWTRDEQWGPGRIFVVNVRGGTPRQIRPEFDDAHYPIWAPDGRHILFCGTRKSNSPRGEHDWWVTPLDSGPAVKTRVAETPLWVRGVTGGSLSTAGGDRLGSPSAWIGNEIFFSARLHDSENIWSARINDNWVIDSAPTPVTSGAGMHLQPAVAGDRLAFVSANVKVNPWKLPLDVNDGLPAAEPAQLTFGVYDMHPSVSADGSVLAFISDRSGKRGVWLRDLVTGEERSLPPEAGVPSYPQVSRDGARIVYRSIRAREQVLYLVTAGRTSESICDDCGRPTDWSPDGNAVLFEPGLALPSVRLLDVRTRSIAEILTHPEAGVYSARFSPDGRWLVFHAKRGTDHPRVFVAPFRRKPRVVPHEWIAVTDGSSPAHNPCWSPDGKLLYFLSELDGFRCVYAQRLGPGQRPHASAFAVRHFHDAGRTPLMNVRANANQVGLSIGKGMLLFALDQMTANIWGANIERR